MAFHHMIVSHAGLEPARIPRGTRITDVAIQGAQPYVFQG
jgi:hypothetical protein